MSKQKFHIDIESLLWLPGEFGVFWKNCQGQYLGCNDIAAEKTNLKSRQDVVGRTDFDIDNLLPEKADLIQKGDKQVITSKKPLYFLYSGTKSILKYVFITFKAPLWNQDGALVGVYGIDTFINLHDEKSYMPLIIKAGLSRNDINLIKSRINFKNDSSKIHGLSKRQADCLLYLTKGMTMKEIALVTSLSPKTVEHYINAVKFKLNCRTRAQLVSKAIQMPYIKEKLNIY